MSTFYVVGTPIGNLEDITFRAIRILKEVDLILCEDTRTTRVLLNKYEIKTKTESYHAKSSLGKIDHIIKMLEEGKNIALVSDAGTPAISDPGSLLISKIHEHFLRMVTIRNECVKIVAVPGPSALISALSISGFLGGSFSFLGFLPHKKGRETLFKMISVSETPQVFYESSHRIIKTLESLSIFAPNKKIMLARELTKMFEETLSGNAEELRALLQNDPQKQRGEFVVIVF